MTAAALDLTLTLFWLSLGVSAAVVCLFLWLMRDRQPMPPESGTPPRQDEPTPAAEAGSRPGVNS